MGRLYKIAQQLERLKSPFAVSRLIMMSGVKVGQFGPLAPDDPDALLRVETALRQMLTPEELVEFREELER